MCLQSPTSKGWQVDFKCNQSHMRVFPSASAVKESTCNAGDMDLIPGLGRFPGGGHGNPLQYSCPVFNPLTWKEQPSRLRSIGSQRGRHNWSHWAHTHTWERSLPQEGDFTGLSNSTWRGREIATGAQDQNVCTQERVEGLPSLQISKLCKKTEMSQVPLSMSRNKVDFSSKQHGWAISASWP